MVQLEMKHRQRKRLLSVAYRLLRVEIGEVEIERVSGFPPSVLRPMSIEPFDLNIDGYLSPCETAKATHLAKLPPQLTVSALQQRVGADEFAMVCAKSRSKVATADGGYALATARQRPSNAASLPGHSRHDR